MSPLIGRTVVVTRATDQAGSLSTALADHGAKVVELPVVSIEESADGGEALSAALARADRYDWIVVTSPNGARRVADVGGPGTSTSSTFRPGATAATASAIPGVRTTRSRPVPSARAPPATGGRLAPVRTESSRDTRTTTGHPCSLARERAAAGASEPSLAPKAPPLANGLAGSPPGTHHEASVSR